ncbi:MAG: AAA family ATPase [Pseudomonadota bacterium]
METRRVIAIGVEGEPLSAQAASDVRWVSASPRTGALIFGWFKPQEIDTENALRAALEVSMPERKLFVREIEVQIGGDRIDLDWNAAFADHLRLLIPGDIVVEPTIAQKYERLFHFEEVRVQGVKLSFLRTAQERSEHFRSLVPDFVPIVGRELELKSLEELVEQITEDQGQIIGIVGDAGIGKTRLLAEFKVHLARRQMRFAEGAFSPQNPHPYEGFRQVAVGLVGSEIETLSRWEMTEAETNFLRLLLEPNAKIAGLEGMKEEEIWQGLFYAVRKLLHATARVPLVVILENLHWADPASINLLGYLLEGLEQTRLLLVLVHRPNLEPTWNSRLNYNEIRLSPLREDEIDQFAGTLLRVDRIALQLRRDLFRLSLGNPLFVEELIRHLKASESIEIEADNKGQHYARADSVTALEIPGTLRALIASRFDQLPLEQRETLQWCAMFGSSFETQEFAVFLKTKTGANAEETLGQLFLQHYLTEKSAFPKRVHRFTHDLIFEVIRQSLPSEERQKRCSEIGFFVLHHSGSISGENLERAAEYLMLGVPSKEAIETLLKVADQAISFHRLPRAHMFLRAAAEMWEAKQPASPAADDVFEPLVRSTILVSDLGEVPKALDRWKQAGVKENSVSAGKFARLELLHHNILGDSVRGVEASERALKVFSSHPELEELLVEMLHDRIHALLSSGRNKDAIHETLSYLKRFDAAKYLIPRIRLWARIAFSITTTGNPEHALEYLERASALVRQDTPASVQVELLMRYGPTLERLGKYGEIVQIMGKAMEIAQQAGLRQQAARARMNRALFALEDGDYALALLDYKKTCVEATEIRDTSTELRGHFGILDTLVDLGAARPAEEAWRQSQALLTASRDPWDRAAAVTIHASLENLLGHHRESSRFYRDGGQKKKALGHHAGAARAFLHSLRIEAEARLRPFSEIIQEFEGIAQVSQPTKWLDYRFQMNATAIILAALGQTPKSGFDPNLQPRECPNAWLRQLCYVARIKWLDSLKKYKEAEELRAEYRKERARIAQSVPKEYLQDFTNHPHYRVPERAK